MKSVSGASISNIICKSCLYAVLLFVVAACSSDVRIVSRSNDIPRLVPDYSGVTIPCNIAPLCFSVDGLTDAALIIKTGSDSLCLTTDDGCFNIPESEWHSMLAEAKGRDLQLTVCRRKDGAWEAMAPFSIAVSADSIDPYVVYRRIQPGYGLWDKMGIYERNLETYDEQPLYENREGSGNCVNCHSFNQGNPDQWQVHIRRNHGGTFVINDGTSAKLNLHKSDGEPWDGGKPVYPSWHPGGRYIAYSTNKTFFHIHTLDKNRWEVMDDGSDVMVVDTKTGEVITSPLLSSPERYETYPAFSPDGKWLYFCSAQAVDTIVRKYDKVKYEIRRVAFNENSNGTVSIASSTDADTAWSIGMNDTCSAYFPKVSPDGRWLCYVRSAYGNFGVCHRDADLWIADLKGDKPVCRPMSQSNSTSSDSWHSWSSNSRWLVFASKREDAMYTRLYFTHVDANGKTTKAFVLPQKNARNYYDLLMDGYNIPELVKGKVKRTKIF